MDKLQVHKLSDDTFEFNHFEKAEDGTTARRLIGVLYLTETGVYRLREYDAEGAVTTTTTLTTDRAEALGRAVLQVFGD